MFPTDPIIGKKLGDYTILELLGKGGMARVYKGYDEALDRHAAVKVITTDFVATADEAEYKERFLREARSIARLRHPNIVGVYQFGELEGLYYMAMLYLDGDDLRVRLKSYAEHGKRMPPEEIVKMAREIASALDYAHSEGVIHRDIKPSNIMMTSRGAALTDFGLALSMAEGTMGDTFGSAHYIAPEQAISSARAVPQSDLYSLGVVLYEAFAGQVPFDDPSVMSVALKHLNEPPPPPTMYNPDIPDAVEKVLLRVLNKEPKDRYLTGKDLIAALEKALKQDDDDTVEMLGAPPKVSNPLVTAYQKQVAQETTSPAKAAATSEVTAQTPPTTEIKQEKQTKLPLPLPLLIVGGLLVILAVAAFWALGQGGGDDKSSGIADSDRIATADAQTGTAIALLPTDTPEPSPTSTLTPTDTPTETPSDTPTPDETETVSLTGGEDETPTPTDTPTRRPTRTTAPTNTHTPEPSLTPTLEPTDTPEPTATLTQRPSRTPRPTNTATSTLSPTPDVPPHVELRYNDQRMVLENISRDLIDISGIQFRGDRNGSYRATSWRDELQVIDGDVTRILSHGCVQLVIDFAAILYLEPQPLGDPCFRYSIYEWRNLTTYHFWRSFGGNTTFVVTNNGVPLVECPIAPADSEEELICRFAIPDAE